MTALWESEALTAADLLAKMDAGQRAQLLAALGRQDLRDNTYRELPMGQEVWRYLVAKRKELTESSFKGWESCLAEFARAFADCQLEDFELPHGADLVEPWMDRRWGDAAPGTYNVRHAIIKDFFRWNVKRQRMRSNPMELVGRARKQQVYRMTYTEDECRAILASAASLRDRIALRLLIYHGLRKDALRKIQFKHFDYQRRTLTIFTKGAKVKPVPLPEPNFWTDLERHILEVQAEPNHYLMCVVKPIPRVGMRRLNPDKPMESTPLHRWWEKRLKDAGVEKAGRTMHSMRHTAGQRILDATGDLKLVQQFLHHANISTTGDVYTNYQEEQVAAKIADALRRVDG